MVNLGGWTAGSLSSLLAVGPLAASAEPSRAVLFAVAGLLFPAAIALDTIGAIMRVGRRLGPGERLLGIVILVVVLWFAVALLTQPDRARYPSEDRCASSSATEPCAPLSTAW